jgi:hypothetical protein
MVLAAGLAAAEPARQVTRVTAADAARAGEAIGLIAHPELDPLLVEVQLAASAPGRLLALAPDGSTAAVADRIDPNSATLRLARRDGSQLRVAMPGLLAAGFAPDGSWLAVLDGSGSLWRMETQTAAAMRLAAGPFLGPLTVDESGTVLLVAVSSVEAPIESRLVRVDPGTGAATSLSDDRLVYASTVLTDGSIALVAHEPGGTVVRLLTARGATRLKDLGPGAVNVAISADGGWLAWERHGDGVHVLQLPDGPPRRVAGATAPRFSPDGRSLLVRDGDETVMLGLDGTQLARFKGQAAFVSCHPECRP